VHDAYAHDLVEVGSVAGQAVLVNRLVAAADCVLAVGTVAAHAEAGYSGGAKALIPGCAGAELIRSLHAIPTGPTEWRGALADNPFRGFLEAAAALIPNLLCLNVVLHPDGALAAATLDDPIAAHRRMSHEFASRYTYPRPAPADLVVVSGGGRPFDSDLHQAEGKAWRVAGDVIAEGAHLLLIGECPNGLGSPELRAALDGGSSRSLRHAQRKLAFLSAAVERCARVDVLHGEHPELAKLSRLGLRRTRSAQRSIDRGLAALGPDATVLVIPSPPYVVWSSAPSPRRKVMS
jgi:nickel-dependent lactate racemase